MAILISKYTTSTVNCQVSHQISLLHSVRNGIVNQRCNYILYKSKYTPNRKRLTKVKRTTPKENGIKKVAYFCFRVAKFFEPVRIFL